ncbi:hypothetical protein RI367_006791 [Sorochytrium milnesiophthora]
MRFALLAGLLALASSTVANNSDMLMSAAGTSSLSWHETLQLSQRYCNSWRNQGIISDKVSDAVKRAGSAPGKACVIVLADLPSSDVVRPLRSDLEASFLDEHPEARIQHEVMDMPSVHDIKSKLDGVVSAEEPELLTIELANIQDVAELKAAIGDRALFVQASRRVFGLQARDVAPAPNQNSSTGNGTTGNSTVPPTGPYTDIADQFVLLVGSTIVFILLIGASVGLLASISTDEGSVSTRSD